MNVLPGDVNGDGVVNSEDISTIRKEWHGKKAATIYGDILGNGMVNGSDYSEARKFLSTKLPRLPKLGGKAINALAMQDRVHAHAGVKIHG